MSLDHAFGQSGAVDGEAVVHRRDLDLAGGEILDRMIGAVMALMHFLRLGAERQRQHLVAEANAEDGLAGFDELPDLRHRIFPGRRRIARAVRQEHAVGIELQYLFGPGGRRHDRHLAACRRQAAQDVALEPIIDSDHPVSRLAGAAEPPAPRPGRLIP